MSGINITFDGVDLQNANRVASRILHDSYNNKNVNVVNLPFGGGKEVSSIDSPKRIQIEGWIQYDSQTVFEQGLDTLKELFSRSGKNLDIDYAGGTRRYVATPQNVSLERDPEDIRQVNYSASFIVANGYGQDTSVTSQSWNGNTTTLSSSITITGSKRPSPTITITINSVTSGTAIEFDNITTGQTITITETLAASDVIEINTEEGNVKYNGTNTDYSGTLEEFIIGINNFTVTPTATAINYDVDIDYTKLYL